MTPSRPQPVSRASSRASSHRTGVANDDGEGVQQAGRSPVNIAAHASALSLREASRSQTRPERTPSRSASTPNLLRKKQRPGSPQVEAIHEERAAKPSLLVPPATRHAQSYEPAVSSPLNTVASGSSSDPSAPSVDRQNSNEEGASTDTASSGSTTRNKTATAAGTALAAQMVAATPPGSRTPILRRPMLRNPEMSQATESSLSLTRQTTPRTVRDLGSDYTRYFNPFATRNNSQQDLNSPLPRYNSSTHLAGGASVSSADLQKRLSNPFQDSKRFSDPFQSRPHTSPGTPLPMLQMQRPSDPEMGIAAAPIPVAAAAADTPERIGTPAMVRNADPEKAGFFPFMDDRLGAPDYAFPLYSDQKEEDDELHMPQWDDDVKLKPTVRDHFTRENVASTLGLLFMLVGLLCIFVVLPVVSYTTVSLLDYTYETPINQMPKAANDQIQLWALVNNDTYPLMSNMRTGLIDPDTPSSAKTRRGVSGDEYVLVFSDEFNEKNRSFWEGDDPYWTAGDFWYGATQDLEWYDPDAANTGDGTLQLQLDEFHSHNLNYRSAMLNSWNQICFKGGIFEVSMSLPGPAGVHGLWPGAWTMGNLGRPGYLATTEGLWPYTYNECDAGITPNQSMTDGTSYQKGQRLASCVCEGEDHPSPGTGRGAPEIDIAEVSGDWGGQGLGVATQSYQVAPYDIWYYPNYDFMETPNYQYSFVNTYTGGPLQQAISTTTVLNNEWYDGKAYQKYAFEYAPGDDENAFVAWTIGADDNEMMKFDARAIGPNGNVGQRLISEEPLAMNLNLGFSHSWVDVEFAQLRFPTILRIDYVRWYQRPGEETVTCDPVGYETTEYIAAHPLAYQNPNMTTWEGAGYVWPRNALMDGCLAASPTSSAGSKRRK
ncbi:beta-glucan synthesis-associated protein [Friedmanniomyces endolithicus]|nr:beta-glucan synthesis-associated protein [Friedmanniomyces endolithicus]